MWKLRLIPCSIQKKDSRVANSFIHYLGQGHYGFQKIFFKKGEKINPQFLLRAEIDFKFSRSEMQKWPLTMQFHFQVKKVLIGQVSFFCEMNESFHVPGLADREDRFSNSWFVQRVDNKNSHLYSYLDTYIGFSLKDILSCTQIN